MRMRTEQRALWIQAHAEAGRHAQAKAGYLKLAETFHGYWLPESLYMVVLMEHKDGRAAQAASFAARLREEYPGNKWTLKLDAIK